MEPRSIRFSEEGLRRLDAQCAALGISPSEYVRRAVDVQLDADERRDVQQRLVDEVASLRRRVGQLERSGR